MQFKHIFAGLICLAGILFLLLPPLGAEGDKSDDSRVQWYSYEDGMKQIREDGKKGYLHFYTDWCSYCRLMDEKTFSDKEVADYINSHFIAMRVNAEKEQKVARSYRANRFPLNWFIDDEANPIGSQPGYIPPEQMVYMLKYVQTEGYETMKFSEFMEKKGK